MKITLRIPREVGEWIEYCKSCSITLYGALDPVNKFGVSIAETFKGDADKCAKWARNNSNDFAYAWVNGYEVEEKYYYIAVPCGDGDYRRVFVNSRDMLVVGGYIYSSEEEVAKVAKEAKVQLTEKLIKGSEVAWAWQFAKELEE